MNWPLSFFFPPLASWLVLWVAELASGMNRQGVQKWYRLRKLVIALGTWSPFVITFLTWDVAYSIDMLLSMISFVMIIPAHAAYGLLVWLALPEYAAKGRNESVVPPCRESG